MNVKIIINFNYIFKYLFIVILINNLLKFSVVREIIYRQRKRFSSSHFSLSLLSLSLSLCMLWRSSEGEEGKLCSSPECQSADRQQMISAVSFVVII